MVGHFSGDVIKRHVTVLLLLICGSSTLAQQVSVSTQPRIKGVRSILDVPYVANGHERQKLDLYLPIDQDINPRPVLVRIHGGAWRHGDKSAQRTVANYVKQGYIGVAINYRFSQHAIFPAQIEDCKAAIRWLRAHASEYGIDPERICVMGFSAGGHLAALLGTTGDANKFDVGENLEYSSAVCAVVDHFGPTDLLQIGQIPVNDWRLAAITQLLGGTISEKSELVAQANPIRYISSGDPPFLIIHGDSDPIVPLSQSTALQEALVRAEIPCDYHVVNGGMHGCEAFKISHQKAILKEFLENNLKEVVSGRDLSR